MQCEGEIKKKSKNCTSKWAHRVPPAVKTRWTLQRFCSTAQTKRDGRVKQQGRETAAAEASRWRRTVWNGSPVSRSATFPVLLQQHNPTIQIRFRGKKRKRKKKRKATRSLLWKPEPRLKNRRSHGARPDWAGAGLHASLKAKIAACRKKKVRLLQLEPQRRFDKVLTEGGGIQTQETQWRLLKEKRWRS